jgi:hypothetical protein
VARKFDTFSLDFIRREQGDSNRINVMLFWSKCIERHVISKHSILMVNNVNVSYNFN